MKGARRPCKWSSRFRVGVKPRAYERSGEALAAASGDERSGSDRRLMERVVERGNVKAALQRVRRNRGSPGIDGMTVDELPAWLRDGLGRVREQLLSGTLPAPAGARQRDPEEWRRGAASLAFRPCSTGSSSRPAAGTATDLRSHASRSTATASGRGGARTTRCARRNATSRKGAALGGGRGPGEVLRPGQPRRADGRLAKRIGDKRVLGLIRRYLEAGVHGRTGWWWSGTRGRRKAAPCRRCWRTCCWTKWIRSWSGAGTPSCATPTTATCTCGRSGRASE